MTPNTLGEGGRAHGLIGTDNGPIKRLSSGVRGQACQGGGREVAWEGEGAGPVPNGTV